MPVIHNPHGFNVSDLFVDVSNAVGHPLLLKCEGINFGGSIKIKVANRMIAEAESSGQLHGGRRIIESSSGNLGVALAMIAANRGYRFTCVTDLRCNPSAVATMRALGADVRVVYEPTAAGGFLGARIDLIQRICAQQPEYYWLNQYANPANWRAHYETTAPEVIAAVPEVDVLFVGAGTTGTLTGCAKYMAVHHPQVRVVGVDSVGSVNFGGPPGVRLIPGLGSSITPKLLDRSLLADVVEVDERDAIDMCRLIAGSGFLFGGSTGTVVAGARAWLDRLSPDRELCAVAIAPDMGDRYLSTVYSDDWVEANYLTVDDLEPQESWT